VAGFICHKSDRDITKDPPKLLQLLFLALDLLLRDRVAEILSGAESDFRTGEEDCSIQRQKKKRCKWLPCKRHSCVWLNWI
jgi:hypothetical protein